MAIEDDDLKDMFKRPEDVKPSGILDELDARIDEEIGNEPASVEEPEQEQKAPQADQEPATDAENSIGDKVEPKPEQPAQGQEKSQALNPGDLRLDDGTIVKAGAERRFYEQLRVARMELADTRNTAKQLRESNERLRSELQANKQAVESLHGQDPSTVSDAVRLWNGLRADPSGTLRTLLTEAAANGIQVLGGPGGPVDVATLVKRQVEEAIKPLVAQQQPQVDYGEQEYNDLVSAYPDALMQEDAMVAVLQRNPSLSMREAYFRLRNAFAERGWDWTVPLAKHVESTAPVSETKAPMPNGRASAAPAMVPSTRETVSPADKSYKDIVREVMANIRS